MKTRFIHGLVIVALLVPLSSCPRTPRVSLGVWIFDVTSGTDTTSHAIELLRNGSTQTPAGTIGLVGVYFWEQDGATIILEPISPPNPLYTGTVDSSTSIIDGTWETTGGGSSGTWIGMKM